MHAVHIGIGCHNHFIITQSLYAFFYVKSRLQQIKLFILIHHLLGQPVRIQRLTAKAEHRLRVYITTFRDRTACRITLGDKNTAFLFLISLCIIEVETAVAQLTIMKVRFLGTFTGQFSHTGYRFTLFLGFLYLLQHHIRHVHMLVQIIIHFRLHKIAYELIHRRTAGSHIGRSQLNLCLTFKHRFFHIDGNGCHQSVTDVRIIHILIEILFNSTCNMLLKSTLMCTPLSGMLPIDKRIILFAILSGVRKGNLYILIFKMNDGIQTRSRHIIIQQIHQPVARQYTLSVINDSQSRIEVSIIAQHRFHKFRAETIIFK